jgi:hypothetical protein
MKESSAFSSELATESCLLKLLPVKKPIFRKLEQQILSVSSSRSSLLSVSSLKSSLLDGGAAGMFNVYLVLY